MLSPHPGKRAAGRFWLLYTPVWGAVCGVVMISGAAERWGDAELLAFGTALALPALLGPLVLAAKAERERPFAQRAGTKFVCAVAAFALLLNYSQTPFFFDVLAYSSIFVLVVLGLGVIASMMGIFNFATAYMSPSTAIPPHLSKIISPIFSAGLMEIPPVSSGGAETKFARAPMREPSGSRP